MNRLSLSVLPFLFAGAASAQAPAPAPTAALLGEYTVTLAAADLPADQQRNAGHWRIGFYADGTHAVRHNGREVVRGTHELEGNQLIHRVQTGPYACDVPGTFTWQASGGQVAFTAVADGCAPRVHVMSTRAWSPVASAPVADQLMNRFAAAWTADEGAAIFAMLADDVIYFDAQDMIQGAQAVAASWAKSMQATDAMILSPIHSGAEGNTAYHVGQWQLTANGATAMTGVYTFIFRRGDDGVWRIRSAHVEDADAVNSSAVGAGAALPSDVPAQRP